MIEDKRVQQIWSTTIYSTDTQGVIEERIKAHLERVAADIPAVLYMGWGNGWTLNEGGLDPRRQLVRECYAKGHNPIPTTIGRCCTRWECPHCRYVYEEDSSD